jgi:hypothetical protein
LQVFLNHPDTSHLLPNQAQLSNNPQGIPGHRGAAYVCEQGGSIAKHTMVAKAMIGHRNALGDYFSLDPVKTVCP